MNVYISNDLTENLIKNLRDGTFDIIVTAIPTHKISDIEFKIITELNNIFVDCNRYKNNHYSVIQELLNENVLLQKYPSVIQNNFNTFLLGHNLICTPKMEVVSHGLLVKLAENDFGIALLAKEFIKEKLATSLFEIKTNIKILKRKLGYAIKSNSVPSFTAIKFIELLQK